jgi:hypothetical protein
VNSGPDRDPQLDLTGNRPIQNWSQFVSHGMLRSNACPSGSVLCARSGDSHRTWQITNTSMRTGCPSRQSSTRQRHCHDYFTKQRQWEMFDRGSSTSLRRPTRIALRPEAPSLGWPVAVPGLSRLPVKDSAFAAWLDSLPASRPVSGDSGRSRGRPRRGHPGVQEGKHQDLGLVGPVAVAMHLVAPAILSPAFEPPKSPAWKRSQKRADARGVRASYSALLPSPSRVCASDGRKKVPRGVLPQYGEETLPSVYKILALAQFIRGY